ncbi:MAG: flagellar protein FlaG [Nitrospinae bacterium]|nr:flagellar protein FlaG [Nitrospinota bacterium]MBL7021521.1 flagellar protein FlaG [Nitrospinaceae bacterium]
MSLTIFPKAFSVGFSPQYHPAKPQSQEATGGPPQVDSNGQVSGNQTDLSTVKIISDDNNVSSDSTGLTGSENKTRVRIDPESQDVIVEVVNDKTGEEVRQIPGEQRLRLSKGISEYNSVAFNHNRPA